MKEFKEQFAMAHHNCNPAVEQKIHARKIAMKREDCAEHYMKYLRESLKEGTACEDTCHVVDAIVLALCKYLSGHWEEGEESVFKMLKSPEAEDFVDQAFREASTGWAFQEYPDTWMSSTDFIDGQ